MPMHRSILVISSVLGIACGNSASTSSPDADITRCFDPSDYFEQTLWPSVLESDCAVCHLQGGLATVAPWNSQFALVSASNPDFVSHNVGLLKELAQRDFDGGSWLLAKSLGRAAHGGGIRLSEADTSYSLLTQFVEIVKNERPVGCDSEEPVPLELPELDLLSPAATVRKVAVDILGRAPTEGELNGVQDSNIDSLRSVLTTMLTTEEFKPRLLEMWNDILLTKAWRGNRRFPALYLFNSRRTGGYYQFPRWRNLLDNSNNANNTLLTALNRHLGNEALELIWHVVSNQLPFGEILTADYTMLSPDAANALGQDNPPGNSAVRKTRIRPLDQNGLRFDYPHAGVLTTFGFLSRKGSNMSNISRGRAAFVLKTFMGIDLNALSQRPVDPSTSIENPTVNDISCATCHAILDPVAGTFSIFADRPGSWGYVWSELQWPEELFQPGLLADKLPPDEQDNPVRWLAETIVASPTFSRTMLSHVVKSFTQQSFLSAPSTEQFSPSEYVIQRQAYLRQEAISATILDRYRTSGDNFYELVVGVLVSPYYRAVGFKDGPDPRFETLYGTPSTVTPETFSRRLSLLSSASFNYDTLLLGGIDSASVVTRVREPNSLSANIVRGAALEFGCRATKVLRNPALSLFSGVILDPGDNPSQPTAEYLSARTLAMNNLAWLLLGIELGDDPVTIEESIKLYDEVWTIASDNSQRVRTPCKPSGVTRTEEYSVIAWSAVVAHLILDPRFLQH